MLYLNELQVVGIKVETAQNTPATLGATDYLMVPPVNIDPVPEYLPRDYAKQSLDRIASVLGHLWVDAKMSIGLKGSGTPGTAFAPLGAALQACGMVETVAASQSVQSVTMTVAGSGYTSAPAVTFTPTSGGTGATGLALVSSGTVVKVVITNPGSGYVSAPTVGFSGGGGSAAAGTAVIGASILYVPTSAPASANFFTIGKSVTLEIYRGSTTAALKAVVAGAVATAAKIVVTSGGMAFLEVTFRGLYAAPTNAATPSTTYLSTIEPVLQSNALNCHLYAPYVQKIDIEFGNKHGMRDNPAMAYGVGGFSVVGREPSFEIDPELDAVATHDFLAQMVAGTLGSAAYQLGVTAGNITTFALPVFQYNDVKFGNRAGKIICNIKGAACQSSGDDWLAIVQI